jgi:hypothetical protein
VVEGVAVFDGLSSEDIDAMRRLLLRMTDLTDRHRGRVEAGTPD